LLAIPSPSAPKQVDAHDSAFRVFNACFGVCVCVCVCDVNYCQSLSVRAMLLIIRSTLVDVFVRFYMNLMPRIGFIKLGMSSAK